MNMTTFLIAAIAAPILGLMLKRAAEKTNRKKRGEEALSVGQIIGVVKLVAAGLLAEPVRAFLLPILGLQPSFGTAFFAVLGVLFLVQAAIQYWREEVKELVLEEEETSWDFSVLASAILLLQVQVSGRGTLLLTLAFLTIVYAGRRRREQLQAARQRDLLLGRIAHELRVPAAAVQSLAEGLEAQDDADQRQRYARLLILEAQRLTRGLERSLQIARGATLPALEKIPLDLAEWAEGLRERWQVLLPKLSLESPKSLPAVVDPERLDEAFDALLDNAMRYGKEPISLSLREVGRAVELRLTQSGDGVPEALRPVLARRMLGELGADAEARGLGCWAAGAVARAHKGDLCLEDPRTFTMTLPRGTSEAEA